MQIICGQCGQLLELELDGGATSVVCPSCMHEISLADDTDRSAGDEGFAAQARRILTGQISVECGECSLKLKVPKKFAGKSIRCPGCGESIKIPAAVFDPEAFDSDAPVDNTEEATLAAAVEHVVTKRHREISRRHGNWGTRKQWLVLGLACISAGVLVFILNYRGSNNDEVFDDTAVQIQDEFETSPVAENASLRTAPIKPKARAEMQPLSAEWNYFANHMRYFPARVGRRYLAVKVQLKAGDKIMTCDAAAGDVRLEEGNAIYACLGRALPRNLSAVARVSQRPLILQPDQQTNATFVFDLPARAIKAKLVVKGLRSPLNIGRPLPYSTDVAGVYQEALPRNLKPMLRDDVMRQLQNAGELKLRIYPAGQVWAINIPQIGISGSVIPARDDVFSVILQSSKGRLSCRAVLLGDGETLIIYLDDEPMHQLVLRKVERR